MGSRIAGIVALTLLVIGAAVFIRWAMNDARRRGKPPLAVGILVLVSFPLGLLVWLVFRPPVRIRYSAAAAGKFPLYTSR